jgi:hypothetical protein
MRVVGRALKSSLLFGLLLAIATSTSWAALIHNQNVINLVKVGIDERDILTIIEVNEVEFVLGPHDIAKLKRAGASDRIIQAMIRKQGVTSPPNQPPMYDTQGTTRVAGQKPPTAPKSPPPQKAGRIEPPTAPPSVDNAEELRLIEQYEQGHSATSNEVTNPGLSDEERRLIEQYEAQHPEAPSGETTGSEISDEERRLIEEYEAQQSAKPPGDEISDEEKRLIEEYEKKNSKKPVKY